MHSRLLNNFYSSRIDSWKNYSYSLYTIEDPELDEIEAELGIK
jgi:hypothetical protein